QQVLLPVDPGGQIEVTMSISERAADLIRENTQAQIKSAGIVGEQIVVLVNPEDPGEPVEEGEYIPGVDPFDLFEITDRTLASVRGFEGAADAFEQIMRDIQRGEGTLGRVIYDSTLYVELVATTNETQRIMEGLATNAEASAEVLVDLASEAQASLTSILEKAESGDGTLAKFLNDPSIYDAFLATTDTLKSIADDLRAVSQSADNAATWGELGAFRFAELMEAAKHNWLFKRYFEERGSIEMAPFEVRERAISQSFQQIGQRERELLLWEERLREWEARLAAPDSLGTDDGSVTPGSGNDGGSEDDPERDSDS
ncbi:MAG: mammalian cell entry protein, partial [Rhodothermales bacterium]|nr:mammalian cell entry protein [Rhodothermales bacterium]